MPAKTTDSSRQCLEHFFREGGLSIGKAAKYQSAFAQIHSLAKTRLIIPKNGENTYAYYKNYRPKHFKHISNFEQYDGTQINVFSFDSPKSTPYTLHDFGHAIRVFNHAATILRLFSQDVFSHHGINFLVQPRDAFHLACACLVHDLGMLKTWLSWNVVHDDEYQRKIHGRLARVYLHAEKHDDNLGHLKDDDIAIISDICELHQDAVDRRQLRLVDSHNGHGRNVFEKATLLLGDILMLADALDFHKERSDNITEPNSLPPLANFEHGINKFVASVSLELEKQIFTVTFKCLPALKRGRKWQYVKMAEIYFRTYLQRQHIKKLYISSKVRVHKTGDKYDRAPFKLAINLIDNMTNETMASHGKIVDLNKTITWKPIKVWRDAFDDLKANNEVVREIRNIFDEVTDRLNTKHGGVLILVHDEASDTLRYCMPENLEKFICGKFNYDNLKGEFKEFRREIRKASQSLKCGISGYAYYCNCINVVKKDVSWKKDPRNNEMPGDKYFEGCNSLVSFPIPSPQNDGVCGICVVLSSEDVPDSSVSRIENIYKYNKTKNLSEWITKVAKNGPYNKKS
jgi:hypothetical protein